MADYILLVGISEYADRYMSNLRLAHRDAQNLYGLFRHGLGFGDNAILLPPDVSLRDFNRQFNAIGQKIKSGDRLIVYFSGHGYQHGDEQYLLLADAEKAEIEAGRLTMQEVISLKTLKARVESWPNVQCLFILDTCRRPLSAAQHRGADAAYAGNALLGRMFARDPACGAALSVAETATATARTLVLNACSDGDYAWEPEDGDASVLVKAFEHAWGEALKRGEAIRIDGNAPALLRDQIRRQWGKEHPQTPWLSPADGVFELRSANQPKAAPPEKESQHPQAEDDDETEWAITCAKQSIEAYESYIRRKPLGKYRDEALRRIGDLASNEVSEAQQGKAKRDEVRRQKALGKNDLAAWQHAFKDAETETLRSEAQGQITGFEQEAARITAKEERSAMAARRNREAQEQQATEKLRAQEEGDRRAKEKAAEAEGILTKERAEREQYEETAKAARGRLKVKQNKDNGENPVNESADSQGADAKHSTWLNPAIFSPVIMFVIGVLHININGIDIVDNSMPFTYILYTIMFPFVLAGFGVFGLDVLDRFYKKSGPLLDNLIVASISIPAYIFVLWQA